VLSPKQTKYRKQFKMHQSGLAQKGNRVSFGDYGLQALNTGKITARQIESARVAINRSIKKVGKMFIRIFPDKPISKKPNEIRMGRGKGPVEFWVASVKMGTILYEIKGVSEAVASEAFRKAIAKLPIQGQLISRRPEERLLIKEGF
jgi:large subunit ribosomal protein L16